MIERMDKTLVIGYGNVDRQDDGAAWHLLARLASRLSALEAGTAAAGSEELSPEAGYAKRTVADPNHDLSANCRLAPDPDLGLDLDTPAADLRFVLQLTPDLAESMADYERVCFVDAHTQALSEALQVEHVAPDYHPSAMTHHMSPATCLAICQAIYGVQPQTLLVSVRGYEFGFSRQLSAATQALLDDAENRIIEYIKSPLFALEPAGEPAKN